MTLSLTLGVDYDELAVHLQQHHQFCQGDDPHPAAAFNHYRAILQSHVEEMMDADATPGDSEMTNILLRNHLFGHITTVSVTKSPGRVVGRKENRVILPLVIISYTI